MTTSQQPSRAALPAKQRPDAMPTSGTSPLSRRPQVEGQAVEAGHAGRVGVARPAAAALGEEHDRQPLALDRRRTAGPSCGGSGSPACRPAPCSRTTARRSARRRPCADAGRPARRPGCGRSGRRRGRRRRCAAIDQRPVLDEAARRRRGRRRSPGRCAARCAAAGPRPRAGRRRARPRGGRRTSARSARSGRRRVGRRPPRRRPVGAAAVAAGRTRRPGAGHDDHAGHPPARRRPRPPRTSPTVPATPASTTYSIFIDSSTTTVGGGLRPGRPPPARPVRRCPSAGRRPVP